MLKLAKTQESPGKADKGKKATEIRRFYWK